MWTNQQPGLSSLYRPYKEAGVQLGVGHVTAEPVGLVVSVMCCILQGQQQLGTHARACTCAHTNTHNTVVKKVLEGWGADYMETDFFL